MPSLLARRLLPIVAAALVWLAATVPAAASGQPFRGVQPVTAKSMRWVALAEATSFIALLVAAVIKRTGGHEIGVSPGGDRSDAARDIDHTRVG